MHPRNPLPSRKMPPIPLDWSKLLGFDQFTRGSQAGGLQDPACAKVGVKNAPRVPDCAKVGRKI